MRSDNSSLHIRGISAGYGVLRVLSDVSLTVSRGEVVALIGANGAGKSSLMKVASGLLPASAGDVLLHGQAATHLAADERVRRGLALVPEGRRLFGSMSVLENLEIGSLMPAAKARRAQSLEAVLALFPALKVKLEQAAAELSGGQQQMVAIGRALMARPRLLLLDEPSLGLSPLIVGEVFNAIRRVNAEGTAVLLVEQNVSMALRVADRAYVLEEGRMVAEGTPDSLLQRDEIRRAYLGV